MGQDVSGGAGTGPGYPDRRPSISVYNHAWLASFLAYAKANNALPNVITWHQLTTGSYSDVAADVADFKALEASLGISPLPISIDEYVSTAEVDVPSSALRYIAAFERSGITNASRAYWFESGTVNGLLFNNQPTGTYWLYKWYGDMTGDMVPVTAAGSQDGIASYDSSRKIVNVVLGGDSGNNSVQVNGLSSFGSTVKVVLSSTPDSGRLANVSAPTTISTTTLAVTNGSVTVPIANQNAQSAYQVLVTPGTYTMTIHYANGGTATSTQGLAYDGGAWSTVSYPPTGSWGSFGPTVASTVTLHAGSNVIRLAKGAPNFAGGTGFAELDSITLKPS